jgi:hypothetical protein
MKKKKKKNNKDLYFSQQNGAEDKKSEFNIQQIELFIQKQVTKFKIFTKILSFFDLILTKC